MTTKIGRYEIVGNIGEGAMGKVFLGKDLLLSRKVAIKLTHSHLFNNAGIRERQLLEAKVVSSLRHPNIIEVYDAGIDAGSFYIVMECADGPSLEKLLIHHDNQPIQNEIAAAILIQAAEGLKQAGLSKIVHRDIKPANFLFTSNGTLKICDFGIAHIGDSNITQTGAILGSPNFMSPEQIEGRMPTIRTDLFSLGAVFYQCLTGTRPFHGANIPTIMRNICDLPHIPVRDINEKADPALVEIIDRLLEKNPDNRPDNAGWVIEKLTNYLDVFGIKDYSLVVRENVPNWKSNLNILEEIDLTKKPIVSGGYTEFGFPAQITEASEKRSSNKSPLMESLERSAAELETLFPKLESAKQEKKTKPKSFRKNDGTLFGSESVDITSLASKTPPKDFFNTKNGFSSTIFNTQTEKFVSIQKSLLFYRNHLDDEYKHLLTQAKVSYFFWIGCVSIGFATLIASVIMVLIGNVAQGLLSIVCTSITYFVQKLFQQREDHYRKLAKSKIIHLEYGNQWWLILQSIEAIPDDKKRVARQEKLVSAMMEIMSEKKKKKTATLNRSSNSNSSTWPSR